MSLAVHLLSFAGIQPAGNELFFALHVGIFPLWLPVSVDGKQNDGRRASHGLLEGRLVGMPRLDEVHDLRFLRIRDREFRDLLRYRADRQARRRWRASGVPSGTASPVIGWPFIRRGLAIVTSAYRRGISNLERRCPNGHAVGFDDRFCPVCGVAISDLRATLDRAVNS